MLNLDNGRIRYNPELAKKWMHAETSSLTGQTRERLQATLYIESGLYLLPPHVFQQIVDQCNRKSGSTGKYDSLRLRDTDESRALYPIIPDQLIDFKPL